MSLEANTTNQSAKKGGELGELYDLVKDKCILNIGRSWFFRRRKYLSFTL